MLSLPLASPAPEAVSQRALEADLQGKSDNIGVCAFIDTRTVKRMCGTYMQEHATNMMYAENIISEDRTGFEHSICEMVKGQRK